MMVLLSVVSMVTATMAVCSTDRDTSHRLRTNCSNTGLSHVPLELEPATQVLILTNNLFSSLSWSSFWHFPGIYEVDLTSNQVPEVTPSSTPSPPTLSVLHLSSNLLTSLQDNAFSACPALIELRLQHNHISSLSSHCFSGLHLLQILDLTSNHIAVLPELLLRPLVVLKFLYLENNQIQVVPADWFIKEYVPYLFLSANPWNCSCHLGYLHKYLSEYEGNVYVRDGTTLSQDAKSVVCASPPSLGGFALLDLQYSDFCTSPPPLQGHFGFFSSSLSPAPFNPPTGTTPHQRSVTVRPRPDWTSLAPPSAPPPLTTAHISTVAPPTGTTPHQRSVTDWTSLAPPSAPPPLTTAHISTVAPPTGSTPTPPLYRCVTLRPLPLPPPAWPGLLPHGRAPRAGGGVRAASFCVWMLIGCLMLCVAVLAAILASSVRLVQMLRMKRMKKAEGYPPLAPPPTALCRSVLFVQRERAEPGYYSLTLRAGP